MMKSKKNLSDQWEMVYDDLKKDKQIWNLFTRNEEYSFKKLDKYDRLSYKASCRDNILFPFVSEYLIKKGFQTEYKDDKKFAIFLSHDIDDINISSRQLFRSIIPYPFHRDHLGSIRFISSYLKKEKPYMNFKKIIEIEKKYGATSSFFFLTTDEDVFGKKYQIEELQDEIHYILDRECEIGLHTGFYSFDDLQRIKTEKEKLEKISRKKVVGVRNHVYRFKIPGTWRLLSQAGFELQEEASLFEPIHTRIHKQYKNLDRKDIECTTLKIVHRRPL